jgi:RNA polymerase sigma-70 factor (ECF subfamily)
MFAVDNSTASERKLVHRVKWRSDRKAADELFGRYYKEIYAYVYRQCGERELAMDLTQDIFIAAFRGLSSFDDRKARFRTWIYHVAANKVTDYYRSKQHKVDLMEIPLEEQETEMIDEGDVINQLITRDRVAGIMEIVSGYENIWVQIFQKKCFEEKTFAQIAADLNISENTAKTRYYTMIKRLRKEMKE